MRVELGVNREVEEAVRSSVGEALDWDFVVVLGGVLAGNLSRQLGASRVEDVVDEENDGFRIRHTYSPSETTRRSKLNRRPLSILVNRRV